MHHYPQHIGDYRKHTAHLTMVEDGAYRRMLDTYYMHERPLPADVAAVQRLASARTRDERAAVEAVLREFFTLEDDGWHNKRADQEIDAYQQRAGRGGKGADSRWGTPKEDAARKRSERLSAARAKARHTDEEWGAVLDVFEHRCVKCGTHRGDLIGGTICKDHVVPIHADGDDGVWNLQPMCRECNTSKGKKSEDLRNSACPEWQKRLTKRLENASQNAKEPMATGNRKPGTVNREPEEGESAAPSPADAVEIWNEAAERVGWPKVQRITDDRRKALKARLAECGGIEGWRDAIAKAEASSFLIGESGRKGEHANWRCDLDFILRQGKFTKLMEGGYDNPAGSTNGTQSSHERQRQALAEWSREGDR